MLTSERNVLREGQAGAANKIREQRLGGMPTCFLLGGRQKRVDFSRTFFDVGAELESLLLS